MIVTDLDHLSEQLPASPLFQKAIQFLQHSRGQDLADGRIEIDGARLYVLFQSYETLPFESAKFEAHKKYIDIQYVASGVEVIGWAHTYHMAETVPYNGSSSIRFFIKCDGVLRSVVFMVEGMILSDPLVSPIFVVFKAHAVLLPRARQADMTLYLSRYAVLDCTLPSSILFVKDKFFW